MAMNPRDLQKMMKKMKMQELKGVEEVIIRFEDLCYHPIPHILQILQHIDTPDSQLAAKLSSFVKIPKSIGRHEAYGASYFTDADFRQVTEINDLIDTIQASKSL